MGTRCSAKLNLFSASKGLDTDQVNNNIATDGTNLATDDNESLNKASSNNGAGTQDTNAAGASAGLNNGSSTPLTSAKQRKMFFNKKVSGQRSSDLWYGVQCEDCLLTLVFPSLSSSRDTYLFTRSYHPCVRS